MIIKYKYGNKIKCNPSATTPSQVGPSLVKLLSNYLKHHHIIRF